jgi:hypothetical protein
MAYWPLVKPVERRTTSCLATQTRFDRIHVGVWYATDSGLVMAGSGLHWAAAAVGEQTE